MTKNVVIDLKVSLSVAAILLDVSVSTVQRWIREGKLSSLDLADVRKLMQRQLVQQLAKLTDDQLRAVLDKERVNVSSSRQPEEPVNALPSLKVTSQNDVVEEDEVSSDPRTSLFSAFNNIKEK